MAKGTYKGLSENEIVLWYKFIVECSKLLQAENKNRIGEIKPAVTNWMDVIGYCNNVQIAENQSKLDGMKVNRDKKIYLLHYGTTLLSVLYRLKNAFIEGNISKKGEDYIFDGSVEGCKIFGEINKDKLFSFIKLFVD